MFGTFNWVRNAFTVTFDDLCIKCAFIDLNGQEDIIQTDIFISLLIRYAILADTTSNEIYIHIGV